MEIFLTSVSILILLYLLVKQIVRNRREGHVVDDNKKLILCVFSIEILLLLTCFICGNESPVELPFVLSWNMLVIYPVTLSFIPKRLTTIFVVSSLALEVFYNIYILMGLFFYLPAIPETFLYVMILLMPTFICVLYGCGLVMRLSDVRFVLRAGSVWNLVCVAVDIVYIVFLFLYSMVGYLLGSVLDFGGESASMLLTTGLLGLQVALAVRIGSSSLFVCWTEHERRIVESMKLSQVEISCENPGIGVLYKNIYDQVLEYFETSRPYLKNDLTINDVVDVMYTNKLYISKAINMHTGRNFCQFVNYYRVMHAVEIFKEEPHLKVVDIATKCGFNSAVSFTMAFRLFMGEKPSDWCRKERARLLKTIK